MPLAVNVWTAGIKEWNSSGAHGDIDRIVKVLLRWVYEKETGREI